MRTARHLHDSYEEHLRSLEASSLKLESCDGVIDAMAGGTPTHAALGASMIRLLGESLHGRCRVYSSDLSRSTEDDDRGDKLSHYEQIPTLDAVLLVSHRMRRVTAVVRTASGWEEREFRPGEELALETPAFRVAVDAIDEGIELDEL